MFEKFNVPKELIPSDPRFGVGPSLIPVKNLQLLAQTKDQLLGTSHRKPAVKKLVKELQENLRNYFSLPSDYEVVIGNGGATFLWDMIGLGLVEKESHHHVCGEFSDKWFKAHQNIPWIEATKSECSFGQAPALIKDTTADLIALTLNETSTGVQSTNTPTLSSDKLICVDATSGAGQIKMDLSKVDLYYFSPQKVLAGEGGLFFAFMSPKAIKRAMDIREQKRFIPVIMDWKLAIENSVLNQTYNTPSVINLFLVNEQVKSMLEFGGEQKVIEEAKRKAQLIYSWAEKSSFLAPFVEKPEDRSQSVATINIDDKFSASDLCERLRELEVVKDIDSYRKLGKNQFRISLFHNVTYENLEKLTRIIDLAVGQNS